MASLDKLPYELLRPILVELRGELETKGSEQNLHLRYHLEAVCCVCKNLQPLAQEILFSTFLVLTPKESWRLPLFFRTLVAKPSLTSHVEHLHLDYFDGSYVPHQKPLSRDKRLGRHKRQIDRIQQILPEESVVGSLHAQHGLGEIHKRLWDMANCTNAAADELIISLLLLTCTNLRSLAVTIPYTAPILLSAVHRAGNLPLLNPDNLPLQHLDTLIGLMIHDTYIETLIPFLRLPSLHTMQGAKFRGTQRRAHISRMIFQPFPPGSELLHQHIKRAPLRELDLGYSHIDGDTLHRFLAQAKITRCLEVFKLEFWAPEPSSEAEDEEDDEYLDRYNLQNLDRALLSIKDTLTHLEIGAAPVDECWLEEGVVLESISKMEKLKFLRVDLRLLMGWNMLTELQDAIPLGLEVLEVKDWETAWFERNWVVVMLQLKAVVELTKMEGGMKLKEIRGLPDDVMNGLGLLKSPVFRQLMNLCKEAGVLFTGIADCETCESDGGLDLIKYTAAFVAHEPEWLSTDEEVGSSEGLDKEEDGGQSDMVK